MDFNRVRNGTPNFTEPSLCNTCREGQRVEGSRFEENVTLCHSRGSTPFRITWRVTECSDYDNKSNPALWDLKKIAWKLSKDDKTSVCGFLDPKKYRKKFGEDGDGLDDQLDHY